MSKLSLIHRRFSPRQAVTVVCLAGSELLVRAKSVTIVTIVDAALSALAIGLSSELVVGLFGTILFWALYGYVIFTLLPRLVPEQLEVIRRDKILCGLLAIGSVVFASFLSAALSLDQLATRGTNGLGFATRIFITFAVLSLLYSLYIRYGRETEPLSGNGIPFLLMEQFVPDLRGNIADYRSRGGVIGRVQLGVAEGGAAVILTFVSFILGSLVGVLSRFYPIPELVFVVTSIIAVTPQVTEKIRVPIPSLQRDPEKDLGQSVRAALQSYKGTGVAPAMMVSVVVSLVIFLFGIVGLSEATAWMGYVSTLSPLSVGSGKPPEVKTLLRASAHIGSTLHLLFCGSLFLWMWLRIGYRLPAFVSAWEHRYAQAGEAPTPTELSRPPAGALVPVALSTIPLLIFTGSVPDSGLHGFGLVWPLSLLFLVLWVRQTFRIEAQPPLDDQYIIPSAFLLQFGQLLLPTVLNRSLEPNILSVLALLAGILVLVCLIPDITKRIEERSDRWSYATEFSLMIGGIGITATGVVVKKWQLVTSILGLIILALCSLSILHKYRSQET